MSNRDVSLDFLRGVGMVLVVLGHTVSVYKDFIYLFHVPLFFIVSGVLFRCTDSVRMDIYKKWKRLYFPNLKYGLLFLALHNAFVSAGIYDSESYYGLMDFLKSAVKVLCWGNEQLGGAMWFLRSLFFAYCLWLAYTFCKNSLSKVFFVSAILLGGWFMVYDNLLFSIRTFLTIPCIVFPFILIGGGKIILHVNKELEKKKCFPVMFLLLSGLTLLVLANYFSMDLAHLRLPNPLLYYIVAFIGVLFSLSLNKVFHGMWLQKMIAYVGKHSIPILALHFLSFKLLTYLLNICCAQDLSLSDFPVPPLLDKVFLPLLYTLFGVAIPLCLDSFYNYLKHLINSKL